MAADTQCTLSTSILSSLIGLEIGIFIFILLIFFIEVVKYFHQKTTQPGHGYEY